MVAIGTQGSIDIAAAVVGDWSDVDFLMTAKRYNMGSVKEGVLEVTRESYVHISTALPRIADYVVPIRAGMRFTGKAEEHHRALWHALMGDALDASSNYIYPGAQLCNVFFTVHLRRERACDGVILEAKIFKVHPGGTLTLGGADEAVGTPFELEGLDDQANAMGHGGSAAAPIGYLWLPTEGAGVQGT